MWKAYGGATWVKSYVGKRIKDLGLEESLISLKGLTPGMLVTLGEKKILTLESFADLASDEFSLF